MVAGRLLACKYSSLKRGLGKRGEVGLLAGSMED
jgi:hypothetical protein